MKTLQLLKDYARTTDNSWLTHKLELLEMEINIAIKDAKIEALKELSKTI